MKIFHILHEFPFPPTSGVRCDTGRRLQGFRDLGHEVFALSWYSVGAGEKPSAEAMAKLERVASEHFVLPIGGGAAANLRRVARLARYPSYVASRIPSTEELAELEEKIDRFRPDLIWLEGVHPAWSALHFARRLKIPLVYRAHNIEHQYLAEQARLASSAKRKLALRAGTLGLRKVEEELRRKADAVFEISSDDLAWWRNQGFAGGHTLLTQADPEFLSLAGTVDRGKDVDLLYFGGLSSPNNIAGLTWFFDQVLPRIRAERPQVSVMVAGRDPDADFRARAAQEGVELVPSPPRIAPLIERSRAVINPILHGSGVNVKTIDMLSCGLPMITTAKGARGLGEEARQLMAIADTPEDFALHSLAATAGDVACQSSRSRSRLINRQFGTAALEEALSQAVEQHR